jgi:hypothetical protein
VHHLMTNWKHQLLPPLQAIARAGHCVQYDTIGPKGHSAFLVVTNRQECSHRRHKKLERHGCHARHVCGLEIDHNSSNLELLCEVWLQHCKFSQRRC